MAPPPSSGDPGLPCFFPLSQDTALAHPRKLPLLERTLEDALRDLPPVAFPGRILDFPSVSLTESALCHPSPAHSSPSQEKPSPSETCRCWNFLTSTIT